MKNWHNIRLNFFVVLLSGCSAFSSVYAQEKTLRLELGEAVEIVAQHTRAESGKLKVVSVDESRQHAFKSEDRIAGYPEAGKFINLNLKTSQKLASLLLNKNNYANIRQRCQNQFFHGIRFVKDQQKVEFAIGIPCNQVLVAYEEKGEIKWWGSVMGADAATEIFTLLGQ